MRFNDLKAGPMMSPSFVTNRRSPVDSRASQDPQDGTSSTESSATSSMSERSSPAHAQAFVEERILRRVPAEILVVSAVLAGGSLLFFSPSTALFVLAGGVFSAASFTWLKSALGRFLTQDRSRAVRSGLFLYLARLGLLIGVFLIIILLSPRMILAFAAGFSSVILVFFVEAVRALAPMKSWKH